MTSSAYDIPRSDSGRGARVSRAPDTESAAAGPDPVPDAPARPAPPLAGTGLTLLALLLLCFVVFVCGLSHVVHARAQQLAYADLREQLANGTAPLSGVDEAGQPLAPGSPVALLEAPSVGIREVVLEGTASGVLRQGPGHRRDTVLPGQAGTAVLFGRQAAFGGPFSEVTELRTGSELTVTTAQGRFTFRVVGVRRGGSAGPPALQAGAGRLTLVTADGPPYLPDQVVRVDADLVGDAAPTPGRVVIPLAEAEGALAGDRSSLVGLLLWTQALLAAACGVAWLSARWGLRQAWVVGVPVLAVLGVAVSASAVQLLPNLL